MDLTKKGQIYDLERFKCPMQQKSVSQGKSSLLESTTSIDDVFETRSRFEQYFLASPRAQVCRTGVNNSEMEGALDSSENLVCV